MSLYFLDHLRGTLREASELKNVTKSGKSPIGGGRGQEKNRKVQNSKFGLFDKPIFHFFPKCKCTL